MPRPTRPEEWLEFNPAQREWLRHIRFNAYVSSEVLRNVARNVALSSAVATELGTRSNEPMMLDSEAYAHMAHRLRCSAYTPTHRKRKHFDVSMLPSIDTMQAITVEQLFPALGKLRWLFGVGELRFLYVGTKLHIARDRTGIDASLIARVRAAMGPETEEQYTARTGRSPDEGAMLRCAIPSCSTVGPWGQMNNDYCPACWRSETRAGRVGRSAWNLARR